MTDKMPVRVFYFGILCIQLLHAVFAENGFAALRASEMRSAETVFVTATSVTEAALLSLRACAAFILS